MLGRFSRRLFPLLQLTRMALVFTAISNSLCTLLIWTRWQHRDEPVLRYLHVREILAVAAVSCGLYGFGMSLNDIIDRRRDRQLAAHRPLPSGRLGLGTAYVTCIALMTMALIAGAAYARWAVLPTPAGQPLLVIVLIMWTAVLITCYDYAGKYLVAPGLLTLGLIRFFHAVIPAPQLPLLWHPLLLLNHVTILSLVAYVWEQKRPPLTRVHWWAVLGGLAIVDVTSIALIWWRRHGRTDALGLWIEPALIAPAAAAILFVLLGWLIRRRHENAREAGQELMLYGLLWLIVYDVAFAAGYVGWIEALGLAMLLPAALVSVRIMRWWGRLIALSQKPGFRRAEG